MSNPYLFTGRRLDLESDLYYYRNRYYQHFSGRFISNDPYKYNDTLNMKVSFLNAPTINKDPSGLTALSPFPDPFPSGNIPNPFIDLQNLNKVKACKPCLPPVGTTAYRGPDTTHKHGGLCPHYHYYEMNQSPYPQCICFWKKNGYGSTPKGIPIIPASGGGTL